MSALQEVSQHVRNMKQLQHAALYVRAREIKEELRQNVRKPYGELIDVCWGDPHRAGMKPLTFVRQVLAACLHPQLVDGDQLPADVRQRAQALLGYAGGSVGKSSGMKMKIRERQLTQTCGLCGLRGGYVELVNLDPTVMKYIYTLFSTDSCAPVLGQLALDLLTSPPQPGDPSYPLYLQETQHIRSTLVQNVKRVVSVLNSLPGFCCQPVAGGAFAFPRIHLPPKAIQKAEELGQDPDLFYCVRLLEEAGVLVSPGCEYGQKEGTHHFRFCIMAQEDLMEELLRRLTSFHTQFMKDYS
ncbi:Alanine aminotransferase 2 [Liparis tanakae]|uniref:Alanine aminotransferase 2 n=1 Tax=Liparis tanakae TaxID=230148 RepID=A0A4Z2GMR1_9TELE|nr:Alanine aminotransferase 2 [Liparis tanakae]